MSTASHDKIVRRTARAFAAILAGAIVTGIATTAGAQTLPPAIASGDASQPGTGLDFVLYLLDSERAHQAAALEAASRAPIGSAIAWTDTYTHASGQVVPLSEFTGFGGARCRDYRVVIDVPRRTAMVWTNNYISYNSHLSVEMPVQVSPAFSREFITNACGAPVDLASAARR